MRAYRLDGALLRWIIGFITNRTQIVKFDNNYFRIIYATSGVPQDSHLGPLLFNIFINDIKDVFKHCKFLLYADDLKFFYRVTGPEDAALV